MCVNYYIDYYINTVLITINKMSTTINKMLTTINKVLLVLLIYSNQELKDYIHTLQNNINFW